MGILPAARCPRHQASSLGKGFGGGATLETLIREKRCGFVGGLDASPKMVRAAGRRFSSWIAEGRLEVRQGTAESLPWADASFDRSLFTAISVGAATDSHHAPVASPA